MPDLKPGSSEAIKAGCRCPVMDNGHGRGVMGGAVLDEAGRPMFVTNSACPIHGVQSQDVREGRCTE